jgi:hypothetical protein
MYVPMPSSIAIHTVPWQNQDIVALVLSTEGDDSFEIPEPILHICRHFSHERQNQWANRVLLICPVTSK